MKKWYEVQKKAGHDMVSNDLYLMKVMLRNVSQCTLWQRQRCFALKRLTLQMGSACIVYTRTSKHVQWHSMLTKDDL